MRVNRREFLKLMTTLPFLGLIGKLGADMATLDELMRPIIDDAAQRNVISLSHGRLLEEKLTQMANVNSVVEKWMKTGANYPSFDFFETKTANFKFMPLQAARFRRTSAQTLSNGVQTAIQWSDAFLRDSTILWDSSDPTKIQFKGRQTGLVYVTLGGIVFAQSGTGHRTIVVAEYDRDDNLLSGGTVAQVGGTIHDCDCCHLCRWEYNRIRYILLPY